MHEIFKGYHGKVIVGFVIMMVVIFVEMAVVQFVAPDIGILSRTLI